MKSSGMWQLRWLAASLSLSLGVTHVPCWRCKGDECVMTLHKLLFWRRLASFTSWPKSFRSSFRAHKFCLFACLSPPFKRRSSFTSLLFFILNYESYLFRLSSSKGNQPGLSVSETLFVFSLFASLFLPGFFRRLSLLLGGCSYSPLASH